jgi:flagellar motor switch protein FliN
MIKKRNLALDTAAELFLTAFNGKTSEHGALERTEDAHLDARARWFRQTFTGPAHLELFAGISAEVADVLPGELTELLDHVFQTMARAIGTAAGSMVSCDALTEEMSPQGLETVAYELRHDSIEAGSVILAVPDVTITFLADAIQHATAAEPLPTPLHMDALMNVDLPVSISFGTTEMQLADVLKLTTGSIVEFNHMLNEPVSVVVNDCLVARGDVVVVDGNYGVRISEVLSHPQK